jgi:CDP-glycerol glycerophosphotransferase
VVLIRAHGLTAALTRVEATPGSVDVTGWPDISDLYLAADVLITDYSSAMVDFALTGKPQLFYTYDLADYRDRIRGFYVDLEAIVPGPLLSTTDEVADALADLEHVAAVHREAYERFVERFCPLDDGDASGRAVRALLAATPAGELGTVAAV